MGGTAQMSIREGGRPLGRYEDVGMPDGTLPVRVMMRRTGRESIGCDFHWHEELEFYYVAQGGVLLLCGGRRQWVRAGEAGFVNWCQLHRGVEFLENTCHYIIQISPRLFAEETILPPGAKAPCSYLSFLIAQGNRAPLPFSDAPALTGALRELIRLWETDGPAARLEKKAAVWNLLAALANGLIAEAGEGGAPDAAADLLSLAHVRSLLLFLSSSYQEPELVALPALSRHFGLSVPYLCRIFRQHTGMTIVSYLQELRCAQAAALIQEGTSLRRAAELSGFQDYNYFSRIFKKRTGRSPLSLTKEGRP